MLTITDLHVRYGAIAALHGISLTVPAGKIVTLIGANGAGKSTTLRAISGIIKTEQGKIDFADKNIANLHRTTSSHVVSPRPRKVEWCSQPFRARELHMGAYLRRDRDGIAKDLTFFSIVPALKRARAAGGRDLERRRTSKCWRLAVR